MSHVGWSPGQAYAAAANATDCEGGTSTSASPCTSRKCGAWASGGSMPCRIRAVGHAARTDALRSRPPAHRQKRLGTASWKSEIPSSAANAKSATGASAATPRMRTASSSPAEMAPAASEPDAAPTASPSSQRTDGGSDENRPSHSAIAPPAEWPDSTTACRSTRAAAALADALTRASSADALTFASSASPPPTPAANAARCAAARALSAARASR
eukprot:scaffold23076_cov95-Isochrysis_galbana.AAC.2